MDADVNKQRIVTIRGEKIAACRGHSCMFQHLEIPWPWAR